MKKNVLLMALALVIAAVVTGCNNSGTDTTASTPTATNSPAAVDTNAANAATTNH
jgi:hypothetical protein